MPRALTTNFVAAVTAGVVRPALLVEAIFDSGPLRLWTGLGDLTWNGVTWTGAGQLLGIEPVEETAAIQANGTRITLTGIPSSLVALALAEPYQGRIVRVYLALLDDNFAVIADPDALFTGRADVMSIEDGAETCAITMSVESRLIDLQRARARRYEHEDQQIDYPGDLGFAFVTQIQDKPFRWGPGG
jgi:hypothetical protein